ncbi:minor tail protein [Gordonia phage SallySpecial]|uniref:Minor tail protein n=1 Tax=Gordonia phage SallySpecial TaxID=2079570 RepID=A0A2P1CBZ0_9CAUD|nr:minor tail protein [Gordonia phage SallySpecial]AVJ48758.1 minor tail protein [Gordonia phage SallySpecial]
MAGLDVAAAVEAVRADLAGAGLTAAADPRALNPPCVWLSATSIALDRLEGATVRVDCYLIAPDHGADRALVTLSDMLTRALEVITPVTDPSLNEAVALPAGGGPMPAFRLSADVTLC